MATMKIALLLLTCCLAVGAQPAAPPGSLEEDFAALARYEEGASRAPLFRIEEHIREVLASPEDVRKMERRFLALLDSDATRAAKDFSCRQLSMIGTGASVPVLARIMEDSATFEMARFALARIPGHEADRVLVERLLRGPKEQKIAILQTLGTRSSSACVPTVVRLMSDRDLEVAGAAASALGSLGTEEACHALAPLRPVEHEAFADAKLRCAEKSLAAGRNADAVNAYKELFAEGLPPMTRAAALLGWTAATGGEAMPALSEAIREETGPVRTGAIQALASLPSAEAGSLLMKSFDILDAGGQVQVISALAARGDAAARPLLVRAVSSENARVRSAALDGLGSLGNAEDVRILAERGARATGREQELARESLYRLNAAGVDEKVLALIKNAEPDVKVELIRATGERAITTAAPVLLDAAGDADRSVRREALRALRDTAARDDVPALIELLSHVPGNAERAEAQRTLASVMRRTDAPVGPIHETLERSDDVGMQVALLWVMGHMGSPESLPPLREAMSSADAEIARQAILSLSEWPDPAPADDLYRVAADEGASEAHRVLAVRGYIRLVSLPSERPNPETANLLAKAAAVAERQEEKKAILGSLRRFPCEESLKLARSMSEDHSLAAEANIAAERIAEALEAERKR